MDLLQRMWLYVPSKRPAISTVVRHFKQFADEQSSQFKSRGRAEAKPLRARNQPYDFNRFVFWELESTIERFLNKLEQKCSSCHEYQAAIRYILKRALDVHRLLQTQHRLPSDVAVVGYCEVLLGLNRFLGKALRKTSVLLRVKSQRVALQSNSFHRRLDELLELLAPPTVDAVHDWRQHSELLDESEEYDSTNLGGSNTAPAGGSAAVTIKRFETDPLSTMFQEIDIQVIEVASASDDTSRSQPWLIRSYDLNYNSGDEIGVGAFGAVYRAVWLGTPVVIKFMGYEVDQDASSRELFLHELRVWFPLSHPHVVKLYGACHVGKLFFVCEYAGNGTLSGYLKREGSAVKKKWELLHQVALGLKYLHEQNILHNDLKCDNVLIGSDGDAKITDFGLSSILNIAEVQVDPKKQGAQQWKSPEYIRGNERPTLASDIYSFGMCILETMTGEPPWGGLSDASVRYQVVRKGNLPNRPGCLTDAQWNLIRMMCAADPSKRVQIAFVVEKLHEFWQHQQQDSNSKELPSPSTAP